MLGSTKVLKVALGKGEADEWQQNLHKISEAISGSSGLFFTNLPQEEVSWLPSGCGGRIYLASVLMAQ